MSAARATYTVNGMLIGLVRDMSVLVTGVLAFWCKGRS